MKTFTQYHEGWFSKKEKEDPDAKELGDLGMKAAGKGGWSKKEQEKYNDLWMKMHKKGKARERQRMTAAAKRRQRAEIGRAHV